MSMKISRKAVTIGLCPYTILLNSVSEEYLIAITILESRETPASIPNRLMEDIPRSTVTSMATAPSAGLHCTRRQQWRTGWPTSSVSWRTNHLFSKARLMQGVNQYYADHLPLQCA